MSTFRKLIYIDANGYPQEMVAASDSVKAATFSTATYELTDTKLGNLISGGDGSAEHEHDSLYFDKTEYVASSAGAGDAGKPIILNGSGLIDGTMIDEAAISHSGLLNLNADDHTQYSLVLGTRAFTGAIEGVDGATNASLMTKGYIDALVINPGYTFTADTALTKGDAVYVSANDNVSILADLASTAEVIGLAATTVADTNPIKVIKEGLLTGVLSGATYGVKYYWNESAYSTSMSSTSGDHVWQVGEAANATDLFVEIKMIKVVA